jgi:hypothetical protein
MTPTDDTLAPPWIWHGLDVNRILPEMARRFATNPATVGPWLAKYPGITTGAAIAWVRAMKEVVATAEDRTKPTVDEIADVVRFAQRRGW